MASRAAAGGIRRSVERFRGSAADERGLTAVEYGLILAFIGLVFVAAGPLLGDLLVALRDQITGGVTS